jgi:hypothetical protein
LGDGQSIHLLVHDGKIINLKQSKLSGFSNQSEGGEFHRRKEDENEMGPTLTYMKKSVWAFVFVSWKVYDLDFKCPPKVMC